MKKTAAVITLALGILALTAPASAKPNIWLDGRYPTNCHKVEQRGSVDHRDHYRVTRKYYSGQNNRQFWEMKGADARLARDGRLFWGKTFDQGWKVNTDIKATRWDSVEGVVTKYLDIITYNRDWQGEHLYVRYKCRGYLL